MSRVDADAVGSPMEAAGKEHDRAYFARMRRSIRWKLLVAYVPPLLVLSIVFFLQYRHTVVEGVRNHLQSVAENQRNTADLFLQERVTNVRNAALALSLAVQPGQSEMDRLLDELRKKSDAFVDVGLFAPGGKLVSYSGPFPGLCGKDYGAEDWYRRLADRDREHHVSDVYLGFRGRPHFVVAVARDEGKQRWVLRASVDPHRFQAFVGRSLLLAEAETEAVIVNPRGERQSVTEGDQPTYRIPDVPPRTAAPSLLRFVVGGAAYLAAFAWLEETDWALVVQVPEQHAFARLTGVRLAMAGMLLVGLAVIVALVLATTRKLVGRLQGAERREQELRRQLFNAAKLASVGEMSAGVAHEINNPLAVIHEEASWMLDVLDPEFGRDFDAAAFRERLREITRTAMRARDITGKLMAFSRRYDAEPEPVDLNEVVDRVIRMKAKDLALSNLEVVRESSGPLPPIMASVNQLEQVFLNLVNNARDVMSGAGRITLRTRFRGGLVQAEVEDTGCGMTEELMEQVFFPFFTTKGVGKGTGLGLSISYGIVKSFGGRIEVTSEVGSGSTLTVSFPVAQESEGTSEQESGRRAQNG